MNYYKVGYLLLDLPRQLWCLFAFIDSPSSSPEPSSSTGLTAREPLMLVKVTQKEGQGHGKRRLESDSESDTEEYTVSGL